MHSFPPKFIIKVGMTATVGILKRPIDVMQERIDLCAVPMLVKVSHVRPKKERTKEAARHSE